MTAWREALRPGPNRRRVSRLRVRLCPTFSMWGYCQTPNLDANALRYRDPFGLYCQWEDQTQDDEESDGGASYDDCTKQGGKWMDTTTVTVDGGNPDKVGTTIENGEQIFPEILTPNNFVRMPLPVNARACSTNTGVNFYAPPGFNVSNIAANGATNGLAGAGAAVGQGGYYDFQRVQVGSTTQFFPSYTPVANIAVGAYVQGTGAPQWMASWISNTYAFFKSSNGATAQQAQFRNLGFSLASGKGTYSCHPQIP
jgi:hypothetical protein